MTGKSPRPVRWMAVIVWVLAIIGIAAVVRRVLLLTGVAKPTFNPKFSHFGFQLQANITLTFLHIIPGAFFMIFAPLQFASRIRTRFRRFHRLSGYALVACGTVIGLTALILGLTTPIGGPNESFAVIIFGVLFLISLYLGVYHARLREIMLHRQWMIRMFAVALAISTIRPIVGLFFALSRLSPQQFFGIAFWCGFTLHLMAAEVYINTTKHKTISPA